MNFHLDIINLHWIDETNDNPADLCLHGKLFVKIGDEILDDGMHNWTVSAGAYRMLESLYGDHQSGYEEHLLPCCGHFMFVDEKTDELIISGCPSGIDWSVTHESDTVRLATDKSSQIVISFEEYKATVFKFADAIKSFYAKCTPKQIKEDNFEDKAYERFWMNWNKMRSGISI